MSEKKRIGSEACSQCKEHQCFQCLISRLEAAERVVEAVRGVLAEQDNSVWHSELEDKYARMLKSPLDDYDHALRSIPKT